MFLTRGRLQIDIIIEKNKEIIKAIKKETEEIKNSLILFNNK